MSSIDIDYIGEAGINAVLTLLKAEIDSKIERYDIRAQRRNPF